MMPEKVRSKVTALIRDLNDTTRLCKEAMIQAPGADRFSLGIIGAVSDFAAFHHQTVLDHVRDETTLDVTVPELTPYLSEKLDELLRAGRPARPRPSLHRGYRLH